MGRAQTFFKSVFAVAHDEKIGYGKYQRCKTPYGYYCPTGFAF